MSSRRPGEHKALPWPAPVRFYVLRQYADPAGDLHWCIVDSSGPTRVPDLVGQRPHIGGYDPAGDTGTRGDSTRYDEQRRAMDASAAERDDYSRARNPDGHVLYLSVAYDEVLEMGLGHLVGR